ncbi:MAG: transketolase family protein [Desulfovibrio sp.]|nr:MAG: transketolase family protein [Desulfovibrio sp.]
MPREMNPSKAEKPTRQAFSERMVEYGSIDAEFMVMEADIGGSTFTNKWGAAFPERYFNMGIAEGNMVSAAAGMAADGRTVVASSYGVFLTMRAVESVRTMVCYPNLNVKFLSSHGGVTAAIDGVTHQATEDIGMVTTLPNMQVQQPCDTVSARKLLDLALTTPGPVFTRLMRDPLFEVYSEDTEFRMGGSHVLRQGSDITIATYGDIVFQALEAAAELDKQGVSAEVIDMYCVKPFDTEALVKSLSKTGALLVAENHQRRNGLGYELAAFCLREMPVPFDNLGLRDTFAESGNYYKVLEKYGISANWIVTTAQEVLAKKG